MQHHLDFLDADLARFIEVSCDFLKGNAKHAVGVDGVDQRHGDLSVLRRGVGQAELPDQMFRERGRCSRAAAIVEFILRRRTRRRRGRINVVPTRVDRQLLGNVTLLPVAVRGGVPVRIGNAVTSCKTTVPLVSACGLAVQAGIVLAAIRTTEVLAGEVFAAVAGHAVLGRCVVDGIGAFRRVHDVGIGTVRAVVVVFFSNLEHGIALECFLDLLFHLKCGQLQQAYGLLQLRRHGERLPDLELECLLHGLIILADERESLSACPLHDGWSYSAGCPASETEVAAQINAPNLFVFENGRRLAGGDDATIGNDVGAIADVERFADVVIGDEHADSAACEMTDHGLDLRDGNRVDPCEGLIEQDERGLHGQCSSDLRAPSLAAREAFAKAQSHIAQGEFTEQGVGFLSRSVAIKVPARLQNSEHVLLDRQFSEHACFLRQVADAQPRALVHRCARKVGVAVLPLQADRTCVGANQTDDHVEGGGLAGAVRPEQADNLSRCNGERNILDHRDPAIGLAQARR